MRKKVNHTGVPRTVSHGVGVEAHPKQAVRFLRTNAQGLPGKYTCDRCGLAAPKGCAGQICTKLDTVPRGLPVGSNELCLRKST